MKLAEEIYIILAGEAVELRPSLRHALRLERREGSFRQLITDINDGSLDAAVAIVEPHFDGDLVEHRVFDVLVDIKPELVAYVLACAGMDADKPQVQGEGSKPAKVRPFSDYLADLYKQGTGWLGWTPAETLDATPAEITLAFEGHLDMLKAIYGGGTKEAPKDDRPVGEKFKSIFAGIGTQKVEA